MYRPVNDCFELCDEIRANHLLFADFQNERKDITKFIFYLWILRNEKGAKKGKDENECMGLGLRFIPNCK